MAELFFKSSNHRERLQEAIQKIGKTYDGGKMDPEYASALYILTSSNSMWLRTQSYVHRDGIAFDEILQEVDFSGGEARLVQLAGNLFNSQQHIEPIEFIHLDGANFNIALQAIKIRRNGLHVDDLQEEAVKEGDYIAVGQPHGEPVVGRFLGWENEGVHEGYSLYHKEAGKMWFNTKRYPFVIRVRAEELE